MRQTVAVTVHEIDGPEAFVREVLQADGPVVVDFYADWCAPCRQVSPVIEALSEKWAASVRFAKLDVDRMQEVASALRVSSIPTVALFEAGEVKAFMVGAAPGHIIERQLGLVTDSPVDAGRDGEGGDEVHVGDPPDRPARGPLAAITAWWRGS
jgi:thioredoxin 1